MNPQKRILVVDDEPNVRLVFRTTLETSGYQVEEADDGDAALDRLRRLNFDLVLLDLRMPRAGGMEVLRRLRDSGNETPVVIVTAHGSVPDAVEAMKLGAIDFLAKPLNPEVLRTVVGDVIRRHAESEPEPVAAPPPSPTVVTFGPPLLDLTPAKRAINRRDLAGAATLLNQALDLNPDSAEALTLLGVLEECRGQNHAAYHSYRAALKVDPRHAPALENLRRYCERNGLDYHNKAINPVAG